MMVSKDELLSHFDEIFETDTRKHIGLNMKLLNSIFEHLCEIPTLPSNTYRKLLHKQNIACDKLRKTLSEEQLNLLNEYQEIKNETSSLNDFQLFAFGYLFKAELDKESKVQEVG